MNGLIEIFKMSNDPLVIWKLKGGKDMKPSKSEELVRIATKGMTLSEVDFETMHSEIKIEMGFKGEKPDVGRTAISTVYFKHNGYLKSVGFVTPEYYNENIKLAA
jgi:hypothetical protein